ncbi:diacylglycerol kinase [Candidatus Marinamargulisbacteria bacterium SCGC AAA071-K20]|nr:diacylglycerol kinase [Candidatus Marinamargulisbacteria bacterium SCGC AAA071-K20]
MEPEPNKPVFCKKLTSSLFYALRGIKFAYEGQRNMKIHVYISSLVLALSYFVKLNQTEFIFILLCIFLVLITEIINSAIEKNIDLYTSEINRDAMLGKDMAAGAVLLTSINAIIIGLIIFTPKVLNLLRTL